MKWICILLKRSDLGRNLLSSENDGRDIGSYFMIGTEYTEESTKRHQEEMIEKEQEIKEFQRPMNIDVNFDLNKLQVSSSFVGKKKMELIVINLFPFFRNSWLKKVLQNKN